MPRLAPRLCFAISIGPLLYFGSWPSQSILEGWINVATGQAKSFKVRDIKYGRSRTFTMWRKKKTLAY
jgi:hypothetical protein